MEMSSLQRDVWIGVDLGTTGVRAIAYEVDGTQVASSEAFYPLLTPHPDWAEENPLQIAESVDEVVRKTAEALRYKNKTLAGIALSTVMHSFAGLGEGYEPLMDMQTWADSRSAGIVRELKADDAMVKSLYHRTGCPVHACYPFAKLLWLKRHHAELFSRMKYVGSLKDYLFERLTGKWLIDHSTASSSGLYNEMKMDWDDEILAMAGVTRDMLPPVVSTTHAEPLAKEAAERLHVQPGLPVVIGATDGVLVNVGIGAVRPGELSATIGTSGAIRMLTEKPMTDENMRTWCYNLVDDMWVAGGAINNGGMILRWVKDKICHYSDKRMGDLDVDPYDLMTMKAAHVAPGADGLILLPYFTGERAPYWNSELRGLLFGLSLNHSRSHIIRAAMEGICYSLNAVMEALRDFGDIKSIRISGSFAKSPLWVQILSDILNEKLYLPANSEGAAYGASVLGFISSGHLKSIADTADMVKIKRVYTPEAEAVATYKELYPLCKSLYEKLQPEFSTIADYQKHI